MSLGNEGRDTDIDLAPAALLIFDFSQLVYQLHQRPQILIGFGGKPDHKIKLDHLPAQVKGVLNGINNFVFTDIFIDHIPQSLTAGFRRDGKTGLANLFNQLHQFRGQRPGPQRRQGDRDIIRFKVHHQLFNQRGNTAVIAGAQRQQ